MLSGERLVPLLLVAVVSMIVLPLPTLLLDLLLVANLAFSLLLLLMAVNVAEPERFTAFPALLLLGTLFRLGLNISTTRQILGTGTAPEVVTAFGEFVIGGKPAVGLVIFLIITLVQFIVIAKGAERVAEVAARFALDAMPGRQMAIDADLRSGILSVPDARLRRWELQRESKLYGALDGSMKFVKGDAIACLLITAVNGIAGTAIGVLSHGLGLRVSLHRYLLFTVGDGLVSQLPALFVAVAAGIVVTRVQEREGIAFGREVISQLGSHPQTVGSTAAFVAALGLLPGIPAVPCVALGAFLWYRARAAPMSAQIANTDPPPQFRPQLVPPLLFLFGDRALAQIRAEEALPLLVDRVRAAIFEHRGVLLHAPSFESDSSGDRYRIAVALHGLTTAERSLSDPLPGPLSEQDPERSGERFDIRTHESAEPRAAAQREGSERFADESTPPSSPERGGEVQPRPASEHAARLLEQVLDEHLEELVDDTFTRSLLELYHPQLEDRIASLIPRMLTVTELTVILRELVQERITIRPLGKILQAILEHVDGCPPGGQGASGLRSPTERREVVAAVRIALARYISREVAGADNSIEVWRIDEELEMLARALWGGDGEVPLLPEIEERIGEQLQQMEGGPEPPPDATTESEQQPGAGGMTKIRRSKPVVVLGSGCARPLVAKIVRERRLRIRVLSYEELIPEVRVRTAGWLTLAGGDTRDGVSQEG